jgi:hypothetical protein
MASARSKKKAKSGKKLAPKKAPAKKLAKAKKAVARKPAPKKKVAPKKPAPKKVVAKKPAAKKVAAPAPKPAAKKPAPSKKAAPVQLQLLSPEVTRALAQADVEGLVSRLPPPLQPTVNAIRKLVLEAAPEASEKLDDGAPAYFANGVFARIEPAERSVLVRFLKGGQLPSAGELVGDAVSLSSVDDVKHAVLRKLVREAVLLNLSPSPQA